MMHKGCLFTIRRGKGLACLLAGMSVFFAFLAGCASSGSESGSDGSLKSQYPALAEHAQMQDEHIRILLEKDQLGAYGKAISIDSVKDMTIGAKVSTAASSYIVRPVFDLTLLNKDSYLDVNLNSSTQAVTEIKLASNKGATSHSEQEKYDFKASGKGWGFKASAAYHQENKREEASSDGTVNVTMSYNNSGAYVELITGGFGENADFTSYLIGSKLDAATVKTYVDYTESNAAGGKYISAVKITNGGQLANQEQENVYGNIQLLGEMERIFGLLKTQYNQYTDATVRATLMANMVSLKDSIANAIKRFCSYNGDSFVSRISAMNYGIGSGQLQFGQASGNSENIYSAALSVGYSGLGFGASAQANVAASRQNGWASAYKKMNVLSRSLPAGVIDTTSWATSISSMLENESSPISVPSLSLPSIGELELLPAPGTKKDPASPPDSCFGTYDDWKQYQADKKANAQQDKTQAEAAKKAVDDQGVKKALNPTSVGDAEPYRAYAADLHLLKGKRTVAKPLLMEGNILRVDKMFVSGFSTTPYDQVIPQLRPNLDIPGQSTKIAGFPNISTLLMAVDKLGQLNSYLRFLSGFAISKVSADVSSNYNAFYADFSAKAFDMISTQLGQGVDIPASLLASFSVQMLGQTGSESQSSLFQAVGSIDVYHYITKTLLDPANAKIWSNAPGGYIPFGWDPRGANPSQIAFCNLEASWSYTFVLHHSLIPYTDPSKNPLSFYEDTKASIKSPWFPIFVYNQSLPTTILFLQTAGPYQIVYGYHFATLPFNGTDKPYDIIPFDQMNPAFDSLVTNPLIDFLTEDFNSFSTSPAQYDYLTWNFSLYFPNATQDVNLFRKFKVLTLPQKGSYHHGSPGPLHYYYAIQTSQIYDFGFKFPVEHPGYPVSSMPYTQPQTIDLYAYYQDLSHDMWANRGAVLLLPINSTTCGNRFNNAFSYSTNLAATDIVQDNSYDATYKAAIMK